ncbi:MAG: septum formation protein, partial [Candidatus Azotimanducaceae bacterium]
MKQKLVLASGSPRRKQLLEQLGLQFGIEKPDVDESVVPGESAEIYVTRLSREKADAVFERIDAGFVIVAADTTVEIDGEILSKPESREEGIAMLTKLSSRVHSVYTGVT